MKNAVNGADGDNTDTGKGVLVGVRLPVNLLEAIDEWNAGDLSRPEAIRQLLEHALIPKPGALTISADLGVAVNKWAAEHAPGAALPEILSRLIEIGLKAKAK